MSESERVAKAIYDATVAKARSESAHVATWEKLSPAWRRIHLTSANAAIAAIRGDGLLDLAPEWVPVDEKGGEES